MADTKSPYQMIMARREIYDLIDEEYNEQRKKYVQEFCDNLSPESWALVLAEETGEVADAILKMMYKPNDSADVLLDNAKRECIHAAAVALSTYLAIEQWKGNK